MSNEGKERVSGKDASSDYDERMEDVATPAPAIDLSNNVQARLVAKSYMPFIVIHLHLKTLSHTQHPEPPPRNPTKHANEAGRKIYTRKGARGQD